MRRGEKIAGGGISLERAGRQPPAAPDTDRHHAAAAAAAAPPLIVGHAVATAPASLPSSASRAQLVNRNDWPRGKLHRPDSDVTGQQRARRSPVAARPANAHASSTPGASAPVAWRAMYLQKRIVLRRVTARSPSALCLHACARLLVRFFFFHCVCMLKSCDSPSLRLPPRPSLLRCARSVSR